MLMTPKPLLQIEDSEPTVESIRVSHTYPSRLINTEMTQQYFWGLNFYSLLFE